MGLCQAAEPAWGRGRAPSCLGRRRVEHRQGLGIGDQLAPKGQRVLVGSGGNFVNEALDIDRVLVQVHTAPETHRHIRVANGMVNQQIGETIGELSLRAGRIQSLEGHRVFTGHDVLRRHLRQNRLPGHSHVQPGHVPLRVQSGRHLALARGVEATLQHVFFSRPYQLDGRAWHFLGQCNRLAHVVGHAAPAKAAAEVNLVHVALRLRQSRSFARGCQCGFAILGGCPDLTALRGVARGRVHGLHAGMVLVRVAIDRLDLAGSTGQRCLDVAILVAHGGFGCVECRFHDLRKCGAGGIRGGAVVPFDG